MRPLSASNFSVNVYVPGVVAVPEITPVAESSWSPGGSDEPGATLHLPEPVDVSVVLYVPPTVLPGTGSSEVSTPAAGGCVTPEAAPAGFTACDTRAGATLADASKVVVS